MMRIELRKTGLNGLFSLALAAAIFFVWMPPEPVYAESIFEKLFSRKKARFGRAPSARAKPEVVKRRISRIRPEQPVEPLILLAGGKAMQIAVIGDSLASNLWAGLRAGFKNHGNVDVIKKTRQSSGLVRDDYYDWNEIVTTFLEEQKPDIAVIMIGINDRQKFRTMENKPDFSSPEWQDAYTQRIDRIIKQLTDKKVTVYWSGLPIMRGRAFSDDIAYLNDIFRERAELANVKYIDIWDAFTNEEGGYSRYGPDLKGRNKRLRSKNGIHFTQAGSRKLAHFVEKEIFNDFGTGPAGRNSSNIASGGLTGNEVANAQPAADIPLWAQQMARPKPVPDKESAYMRVIVNGGVVAAKSGRADDFSWPRR